MSVAKHTAGPWENREGEIIADTRAQSCCGQPCVGAEYMGQQEMVCCGNPDVDGDAEDIIARVTYECDIPLIVAAPDLLKAARVAVTALAHITQSSPHDEAFYGPAYRALDEAIAKATTGEQA